MKHFVSVAIFILFITVSYGQKTSYLSFQEGLQESKGVKTLPERITHDGGSSFFEIEYNFTGATISHADAEGETYDFLHIRGLNK
ncbi:MAG: hypothetical protein HQ542_07775, partial [Bacteroidia bacterium]|nr:hypothetical protein [Bacteroidia bacterium]